MVTLNTVQQFFPDVKTVKDAKKPIQVEVTQRDVDSSKRGKHKECAMATACKRKMELDGVLISRSIAYVIKGTKATRFAIPVSLEREVTSFDRGAQFEPGTYALSRPSSSQGHNKPTGPHATKTGKKKQFRHTTTGIRAVLGGKDARV